jgi:Asp-tRNA(Asn)/Glu-tRNA(Gln) amidotransferase A subunit family amidase
MNNIYVYSIQVHFNVLGMVPFAIGSETAGSITYPAARCGATALRPTFGTVARTGVMSISESLVFSSKFSVPLTD